MCLAGKHVPRWRNVVKGEAPNGLPVVMHDELVVRRPTHPSRSLGQDTRKHDHASPMIMFSTCGDLVGTT